MVLGEGDATLGVVEVEGSRYDDTILKIGQYLASKKEGLCNLQFGVFLAYAYSSVGIGAEKHFEPLPMKHFVDVGASVSHANPGRQLVSLTFDKTLANHARTRDHLADGTRY